ncbi:MAG: hypothetical protein JXQ82_07645 [Methanomicrobiaceae archaeon]|nr:hypothetical protein [Methanomicrobiaceae archaeon]
MSESWYRLIQVQIDSMLFDSESCDIEFKIKKSNDSSQNSGEIVLWNQGRGTLDAIIKDRPLRIKAGYQGDYGVVFEGYITEKETERDGADVSTIISCSDASRLLYESEEFILNVAAESKLSDAVSEVFSTCSIPTGQIDQSGYRFPQARTFAGTGQKILEELQKIINGSGESYTIYTEGGMGYFVRSDNKTAEVFEINSSTGLLSAEKNESDSSEVDAKIKTLLNWKIRTDSWLRIESPNVNGLFKVLSYTHTLKNETYETEMEVKAA